MKSKTKDKEAEAKMNNINSSRKKRAAAPLLLSMPILDEEENQRISADAILSKLNSNLFKPVIRLQDMVFNDPYKIQLIKKVQTQKYGQRIVVELEEFQVYLPNRYTLSLDDNTMDFMNSDGRFFLTNTGNVGSSSNLYFTRIQQSENMSFYNPNAEQIC